MGRVTDALLRAGATDGKTAGLATPDFPESFPSESANVGASEAAQAAPPSVPPPQPARAVAAGSENGSHAAAAQPPGALVQAPPQQGTHRDPLLDWDSGLRQTAPKGNRGGELAVFRGFKKNVVEKLTVENGASGGIVEEYRKLAATLHHAQSVHGLKTIMVSSAAAGEGKTLTSVNLALTLSESYRRQVLLIDCDLRKPSVHDIFDVQNTAGMIHVLSHGQAQKVPLVEVSPRLKLLLSGGVASDPMGLLSSKTLQNLVQDASAAFDWVIIDTPPAAFLPDCNLLASIVDAALLVVRAFDTPYQLTQRAVEAIGREKILGVVMNRAERPATAKYYYGYYNYS